jgi:hypothetical protein
VTAPWRATPFRFGRSLLMTVVCASILSPGRNDTPRGRPLDASVRITRRSLVQIGALRQGSRPRSRACIVAVGARDLDSQLASDSPCAPRAGYEEYIERLAEDSQHRQGRRDGLYRKIRSRSEDQVEIGRIELSAVHNLVGTTARKTLDSS